MNKYGGAIFCFGFSNYFYLGFKFQGFKLFVYGIRLKLMLKCLLKSSTYNFFVFGCWKSLFYACYVCPPRVNVLPVLEIFNIDRMQNFWWLEVLQKWICTNYINYPFFLCTGEQISGDGYSWLAESMWNDKRKR